MTATTATRPAPSAGVSPEELATMRQAAARLSPAPSENPSAPDPFGPLALSFTPGPPGNRATWQKLEPRGHHWCL